MTESNRRLRLVAVVSEAASAVRAQPVASCLAATMVAAMCAILLLTIGRTDGSRREVLATIDSAGTRSIVVRADPDAGLETNSLDRIATIQQVQSIAGFGPSIDVANSALADSEPISLRRIYSSDKSWLPTTSGDDRVVASPLAASALRFSDSIGAVEVRGGPTYVLAGEIELPRELDFLDPVLLQPTDSSQSDPLRMLVITVDKPGNVSAVTPMVKSFLGVDDPSKLRIESNEKLAELRGQVSGQIGADNRGLVMLLTGLTGVLLSAILYGLVMLRRKDYGRRRALGASRSLIVGLVVVQTTITSTLGAACGTSASLIAMVIAGDRWPSIEILSAVTVVTITTGTMAAVVPAVAASRRDPITELRVP